MLLETIRTLEKDSEPLRFSEMCDPSPAEKEILVQVSACGVCHTELDEIEGRTMPHLPVVLGHQVVGRVAALGKNAGRFNLGDRVGVAWIFSACGACKFCRSGDENLCADFRATGRDVNGGYAELMTVHQDFAYPLTEVFTDAEAAPLLCAGAIGYRSLRLSGIADGQNLGLTGFGASAHLVLKMVRHKYPHVKVFIFARSERERAFAKELGAVWSGDTTSTSPQQLDAIIDTTPAWMPIVEALKNLEPGGRLVINAIRKEEADKEVLLSLNYSDHLWLEKEIKSVANVARTDVSGFLQLAADMHIKPEVEEYALQDANRALAELKSAKVRGAKVLRM
ncbi:MAG: zinc-dependent alcohol dehydrogenase family protein [Ignavibacteriales bacterium]|nr:zinc-dependent alcohol dehydrogenase family protein [Ignavibacteriales bacterium]